MIVKLEAGSGILIGLVAFLLVQDAAGGKLKEFAQKATGKPADPAQPAPPPPAKHYDTAATAPFGSGTYPSASGGESFLGSFWAWMVASPFAYRHEDPSSTINDGDGGMLGRRSIFPEHVLGEATVPYARLDYNRQRVDADIDADDMRVELGYKVLAFHGRVTRFTDQSDGYELDVNQFYGVLRYGGSRPDFVPGTFEVGIGLGVSQIKDDGAIEESGGALTFPLKYYPLDWCGIEFRPAWYTWSKGNRVGDYDLSASVGHRFLQLRGGYRWLTADDVALNGPYVGVSASF